MSDEDMDIVHHVNGLYVGQLNEEELQAFNRACKAGKATRTSSGAGWLLGLPKVMVLPEQEPTK